MTTLVQEISELDGSKELVGDDGTRVTVAPGGDVQAAIDAFPGELAKEQAAAIAAVEAAKATAMATMQYTFGGVTYTVNLGYQDQIDAEGFVAELTALNAASPGATAAWEIVPGVSVQMTLAQAEALQAAGVAHISAVDANQASLIAQINAATTPAAVRAINPSAGWPT